jgi:hypothetical protein
MGLQGAVVSNGTFQNAFGDLGPCSANPYKQCRPEMGHEILRSVRMQPTWLGLRPDLCPFSSGYQGKVRKPVAFLLI